MSRTLHVIDQPGQIAEAAVLRLSFDVANEAFEDSSEQHAWLLFGGEPMRDAAHAVGLRDYQFRLFPRPTGLYKYLSAAHAKSRQIVQHAHRVVCWTEGATQIASLIGCTHIVRRVEQAGLTDFARQHIARAHDALQGRSPSGREALRERWGVEPNTCVIPLLGDRFDNTDASAAMMAIALVYEALRAIKPNLADIRLLCHPLAKRRREAEELVKLLQMGHLLIQDDRIALPWMVLPGCDAALALKPDEAGLSILWADAMAVPTFAPGDTRLPILKTMEHIFPTRSIVPRDLADALTKSLTSNSPALSV